MPSDVNAAYETGRVTGQIICWIILLAGILKCWSISRRPTTNTKCALSLMLVLVAAMLSSVVGTMRGMSPSIGQALALSLLGLGMLAMLVGSIVLAILGLVEVAKHRETYTQGRAQAIWALVLAGIFVMIAGAGFVTAIMRTNGFALTTGKNQPGKIVTFTDLNFQMRVPDHPWVPYDLSKINKSSQLAFMRRNPEAYISVIAEKLGAQMGLTSEQLAELGKQNMRMAGSSRVISEVPRQINGLTGLLVESESQIGSFQLHYWNWYYATNGYAYQLITYCRDDDQQQEAGELANLLTDFQLIDPNRIASFGGGFTTNYYSARNNYEVVTTNSNWHEFGGFDKTFPMAELGLSQGDSCLTVVPIRLGDERVNNEAVTAAFLAMLNIAYPNENISNRKILEEGRLRGEQFDFNRDVNGVTCRYRFKIGQKDGEAYMVAAWTQRRASDADAILTDALERVKFLPPTNSPMGSFSLTDNGPEEESAKREQETRSYFLNQAGLYCGKQGNYEQALPLYRAAAAADGAKSIYVLNALNTWQQLDRPKEALAFLGTLADTQLALPAVRAYEALFQAQAMLTAQAITNYASVFAAGYRNDFHLTEYASLLAEQKQYDTALGVVQDYLKGGDSLSAQILEARIYRLEKDLPKATRLLKDLREKAPFDTQVASALAETFLQAEQYSEALGIAKELLDDNGNSAYYQYLKGRSELGLKWYREAKISFTEAVKLAPANKDMRSYLDHVSGLLGEGDNTAVLEAIEPVALPAVLTNLPTETMPAGYATNSGAYYLRYAVAVAYVPGQEYKTTEYRLVRVLDASGVSSFSTVQITFDPLSEQMFVNELRVVDAEGKTVATGNPANYYVLDDPASMSASQKKVLNIPVPGLQPGCELSVTFTRRQQGHLEEFPFCAHFFAATVPVLDSLFFLAGDAKALKYHTSPALEPQKLPEGLCWRIQNPIVAHWEPLQPPAASFLPVLWISDASAQWPVLASNYLATIKDRLELEPELRSRSQSLVAKADTADAKIAVLASFVQSNLTYKAIEFGRRARLPNKPADILNKNYGDCKDHAVLLQQMLLAVGVPADLALVNHRGPIQKDLPSLDQFDHMIVHVQGAKGDQFLDCTSKGADVANAIPAGLAGQEALILDAHNPRFATIPPYPADASSVSVQQHLHLTESGDLMVEESLTLVGVHGAALREYLMKIQPAYRHTFLQNAMGTDVADLKDLEITGLDAPGSPLRLQFSYSLKKQFRQSNNQFRGLLPAGFARSYLAASPVEDRRTPFEITLPGSLSFKVQVDTPAGYRAVPPEHLELKLDPRFASGQGTEQMGGSQLNLAFQCRLPAGKFEAADYAAYQQTMAQALSFIEREVAFKADAH